MLASFYFRFSGYAFTWCNNRRDGVVVKEHLDRICANTDWSIMFPIVQVSHVDFNLTTYLFFSIVNPRKLEMLRKRDAFISKICEVQSIHVGL